MRSWLVLVACAFVGGGCGSEASAPEDPALDGDGAKLTNAGRPDASETWTAKDATVSRDAETHDDDAAAIDASDPSDGQSEGQSDASHDAPGPTDATPDAGPLACNGDVALCARRFDEVAYPTTHNAMSNADEAWLGPNQHHGITRQLQDGVRGLMLDTHYDNNLAYLCHANCLLGKKLLRDGLAEITDFLNANPREIVSIIFESYISAADTKTAFSQAGLLARTHAHTAGTPWPTLAQLIASDQRVVVFTDHEGGAFPWYMDVWAHAFETHYDNKTKADLSCRPNRGASSNALFILNHFLTNPIASDVLAATVNYDPYFLDKAHECQAKYQHLPNFVTVDFYDVGDVLTVTRSLNGIP